MIMKTRYISAFSPSYSRSIIVSLFRLFNIVPSTFHYRSIDFSLSFCRVFTIVVSLFPPFIILLSRFQHRTIVFSTSYYRVFNIVLSCFQHRTIVFPTSYYRVFNIVISCFFIIVLSRFHCLSKVHLSLYNLKIIFLSQLIKLYINNGNVVINVKRSTNIFNVLNVLILFISSSD